MKHKFWAFAVAFTALCSCTNENENIQIQNVNNSWQKNKPVNFEFTVDDAQIPKNIIFVVRNNNSYPFSNVRFFVTQTDLETKKTRTDTVNFTMAKPNGEWLGKGFGETKEMNFAYRNDYKFPKNGKYQFSVKQAMRRDTLKGIEDLGIKIVTNTP